MLAGMIRLTPILVLVGLLTGLFMVKYQKLADEDKGAAEDISGDATHPDG